MKLKENENVPNSEIFVLENGEPTKRNIEELLKSKKVVIFGQKLQLFYFLIILLYFFLLAHHFLIQKFQN